MPIRLIIFILTLLIIVTFIGFNTENRSDIRFWFGEKGVIKNVPIFLSFFVMYILGVFSVIPSIIGLMRRKKNDKKADSDNKVSKINNENQNTIEHNKEDEDKPLNPDAQ